MNNCYYEAKHGEQQSEYALAKENEFRDDLQKAEQILEYNRMNTTQNNFAKLNGISNMKMSRKLKEEALVNDPIFGLVGTVDLPLYMMNKSSPINYGLKPHMEVTHTLYNTLFKGMLQGSSTYTHYHMNQNAVTSTNDVVVGGLKLPVNVDTSIELPDTNPADVLAVLLVGVLTELNYFHHAMGYDKKLKFTQHLVYCFQSISRSDTIYSQSPAYKYLQTEDKKYEFTKLFERYGSYQVGISGYRQRLTPYAAETVLPAVLSIFEKLEVNDPSSVAISDIVVPNTMFARIKPKDMFYMLSLCKGRTSDGYIIKNDIEDKQASRKYSVMTSISGNTRSDCEYVGYDISACMQSIALGILGSENYPVHSMLMRNKHRFRRVLMKRLDKKLPEVKEILSAADNGNEYKRLSKKSRLLDMYITEAETLAMEFNNWMKQNNEYRYKVAIGFAKDEYVWDGSYNSKTGKKNFKKTGKKNKYSTFFFCWTQIERDIRDIMIEFVPDGVFAHEVHDAIYVHKSTPPVDITAMEQAILDRLGLLIKIEKA